MFFDVLRFYSISFVFFDVLGFSWIFFDVLRFSSIFAVFCRCFDFLRFSSIARVGAEGTGTATPFDGETPSTLLRGDLPPTFFSSGRDDAETQQHNTMAREGEIQIETTKTPILPKMCA